MRCFVSTWFILGEPLYSLRRSSAFIHRIWRLSLRLFFLNREALVSLHASQLLMNPAGPLDFDGRYGAIRTKAEGQREIARRAIGRAAVHGLRLRTHAHYCSDSVAVALGSLQAQL